MPAVSLLQDSVEILRTIERSIGLDAFPMYRQKDAREEAPRVPFLLLFIAFTLFVYVLETYLDLRQHRKLHAKTPPSSLLSVLKRVDGDNDGLGAVSKVLVVYLTYVGRTCSNFDYYTARGKHTLLLAFLGPLDQLISLALDLVTSTIYRTWYLSLIIVQYCCTTTCFLLVFHLCVPCHYVYYNS